MYSALRNLLFQSSKPTCNHFLPLLHLHAILSNRNNPCSHAPCIIQNFVSKTSLQKHFSQHSGLTLITTETHLSTHISRSSHLSKILAHLYFLLPCFPENKT